MSNVTIRCELPGDGNLMLKISATEEAPTVDRITAGILDAAKRHADEAFELFQELKRQSINTFLDDDRGRRVRAYTDSSGNLKLPYEFFEMTNLKIVSTTVEFSIGSQVAAATRDKKRLEFLAERSVFDYYESTGRDQPGPDQYIIARSEERRALRVSADGEGVAENVTVALLSVPRGRRSTRRPIDYWPPATTPYWGSSTLVLAAFTVAIAAFRVSPGLLWVTVLGLAVAVGFALIMSGRDGASIPKTALGMFPSVIVLGFAVYYGLHMMGRHPSVTVAATSAPHLVDALLLSLGMASTGGFFDLGLHTTAVRVAAFLEMLLMVSVAGSSLYVGAQAAWGKLANIVSTEVQG
jgi:hypothetical protein